ncbi:TIM barrel protein [Pokkaliibacter sp. MBI-7]|uniref:sugar phosphate isomerase/epimerase family protein n=1 Tax=Pokkaliibacter sp. MBI-7 TaxID=3040600 RepID=UPI0024491AB3|nr:TIM barrel protein [Pokkaliibacter sp. MBI-7]MDH2434067.1 TIM barrel protein [Pokkaliibacter sp. MBI-7]
MSIKIASAPCCWGVDDPKNPFLPHWKKVLHEASTAGYKGIELGPYGYIPLDIDTVSRELQSLNLNIIAGTIFDDLVEPSNLTNLLQQAENICQFITRLPMPAAEKSQKFPLPYLVIIDWGHPERDIKAGHSDTAPRLSEQHWQQMMTHIRAIASVANKYGVRSVIHPHAGGYIEFADEIEKLVTDISYDIAGLCLDTGHLYYSGMDPETWLRKYSDNIDYIHFKDIDSSLYQQIMQEEIKFFDACARGVMCPIGKGAIDYTALKACLEDIDYHGFITIEQERDPCNSDTSLRDVTESRLYLAQVGFNH